MNIPNEIKENMIPNIWDRFTFYSEDELREAMIGYHHNSDNIKINDWFGDNYLIIGVDNLMGDPIIVKTDEKEMPVYHTYYDDWTMIFKICDSYKNYKEIIKIFTNSDKENKDELIDGIKKLLGNSDIAYWEELIGD